MSIYYSKYDLNTYYGSAYFRAHVPTDYPIQDVLERCRSFRRLPPRLRELSTLAKKWVSRQGTGGAGVEDTDDIDLWYDEEGYELDPYTKRRLTDEEIDSQWPNSNGQPTTPEVKDIPLPKGGFADPNTWKRPSPKSEPDPDEGISEEQLIKDIASHGREFVANEARIPKSQLKNIKSDRELARLILGGSKTGKPLAIGDAESPEPVPDTPPTLVSDNEIQPALRAFRTEQNKPVSAKDIPRKVRVTTDWGTLRAVVVGSPDNDVLPTGETKKEFDRKLFKRAMKQTDKLCKILEKEKVKVFRPELISPENAQAEPTGLESQWARDVFTVVGNKIIVNQLCTPHRNKDRDVMGSLFTELEHSGKAKILYPPLTDWQRPDKDLEKDPRPFLEGGDIFRLGDDVLVTMSHNATSEAGYQWLASELAADGINVWPAYLASEWDHGDLVFFPVRKGLCIAHPDAFKNKELPAPCQEWEVIEITRAEASDGFAANGLVLEEDMVLIPVGWPRIRRALEKKGVYVIEVPWDGPTAFGGGIGRAVNVLWRDG